MDETETGYESACLIHPARDKSPVLFGVKPTKYLSVSVTGRKFLGVLEYILASQEAPVSGWNKCKLVWLLRSGKELTQVTGVETGPLISLHHLHWASVPFIITSNKQRMCESRGDNIWEQWGGLVWHSLCSLFLDFSVVIVYCFEAWPHILKKEESHELQVHEKMSRSENLKWGLEGFYIMSFVVHAACPVLLRRQNRGD
jgi:hypothetical protein